MGSQLSAQTRAIASAMLHPGADKHQIFAVDLRAQYALLRCHIIGVSRLTSNLIWGYFDSRASSSASMRALGGFALKSFGNAEAPAPRNGMQFPSHRSVAIQSKGNSSRTSAITPFPEPAIMRQS